MFLMTPQNTSQPEVRWMHLQVSPLGSISISPILVPRTIYALVDRFPHNESNTIPEASNERYSPDIYAVVG